MLRLHALFISLVLLVACASICAAQIINNPNPEASLAARDARAQIISAGTAAGLIKLTADPSARGGDVFHIVSASSAATISLLLPNGTEVTAANAATRGFGFSIVSEGSFTDSLIPSLLASRGTHTIITLPSSALAGDYQVKVNTSTLTTDTLIVASYFSSSAVRAGIITNAQLYRVGDTVLISGLIFDGGTPITNVEVTAAIGSSAQDQTSPIQINLIDSGVFDDASGDGIYTGTFTADRAGDFSVAIQATGTSASGARFSRFASTSFRVEQPLARFTSFQDAGADDNGNNQIDRVTVTANVNVQVAGQYQFALTLLASNGERIKASRFADLMQGTQQVFASFSAAELLKLGVDGPYEIKDAILTLKDNTSNPVADFRDSAGRTNAYALSSVEHPPLSFNGQNTVTPLDTNGNGKFDVLTIQSGIYVARAGYYQWSGILADTVGKQIDFVGGRAYFYAGDNNITFNYSGDKIGHNGKDGPYSLRSVLLFGGGKSLIVEKLLDTQAFSAAQFEGYNVDTTPPTITINAPVQVAYTLNQAVTASYTCTDQGSGIATCNGTLPSGSNLDTSFVGAKTFSVTAMDVAGNNATASVSYAVSYNIRALYDSSKPKQIGSTVPIKIQLVDANGNNMSAANLVVTALGVMQLSAFTSGQVQDAGDANPDNNFRFTNFDGAGGYIFNLKTTGLTTGTYVLSFKAGDDPTIHTTQFQLK